MDSPTLSIILVSWNRRDLLRAALDSITHQRFTDWEIVVVDNGSTDGTAAMLREGRWPRLTLYASPDNLNASEGRNVALRLARGRLVLFMDSDAELYEPDTLGRMVERFEAEPDLGGLTPAIYLDRERNDPWFLGGYVLRGWYCDLDRGRREGRDTQFLTSCFTMYRAEAVERAGGFDTGLPYGHEDHDLSLRVATLGLRLDTEPGCAVQHRFTRVGRILGEEEGWRHYYVDERARNRIQLRRFGLLGYLHEEAWQWSAEGRRQRHFIYLNAGLSRRRKLILFVGLPILALLGWPWFAWRTWRADWLRRTVLRPGLIERPGSTGQSMDDA